MSYIALSFYIKVIVKQRIKYNINWGDGNMWNLYHSRVIWSVVHEIVIING